MIWPKQLNFTMLFVCFIYIKHPQLPDIWFRFNFRLFFNNESLPTPCATKPHLGPDKIGFTFTLFIGWLIRWFHKLLVENNTVQQNGCSLCLLFVLLIKFDQCIKFFRSSLIRGVKKKKCFNRTEETLHNGANIETCYEAWKNDLWAENRMNISSICLEIRHNT